MQRRCTRWRLCKLLSKEGATIHIHGLWKWYHLYLETPAGTVYLIPNEGWDQADIERFFAMHWTEMVQVCREGKLPIG